MLLLFYVCNLPFLVVLFYFRFLGFLDFQVNYSFVSPRVTRLSEKLSICKILLAICYVIRNFAYFWDLKICYVKVNILL